MVTTQSALLTFPELIRRTLGQGQELATNMGYIHVDISEIVSQLILLYKEHPRPTSRCVLPLL